LLLLPRLAFQNAGHGSEAARSGAIEVATIILNHVQQMRNALITK
jgi:hypothetical protein